MTPRTVMALAEHAVGGSGQDWGKGPDEPEEVLGVIRIGDEVDVLNETGALHSVADETHGREIFNREPDRIEDRDLLR